MRQPLSILFFTLLFTFSLHVAQAQVFSFQQMGVEEGLSQSVATALAQDHKGRLWVGSMSGLSIYDGHDYSIISEKSGLAEDWITTLQKDRNNNIWIGHWGGGVTVWNSATATFKDLHFEKYSDFKSITGIIEDEHNNIWFATDGAGVFVYEIQTQTIVSLTKEEGFVSNKVYTLCKDRNNSIWFGTDAGIAIYDTQKEIADAGAFSVVTISDGLTANQIHHLSPLKNGALLASTPQNGLNIITVKQGQLLVEQLTQEQGLPSNNITATLEDIQGNYWIGTTEHGVLKYDPTERIVRQFSTRQGLNYFNVKSLLEDRERNIWIGTDLGVNMFKGEQFLIYNESDGIVNNIVWAVAGDHNENIWLGTNKGLSKLSFSATDQQPVVTNYGIKNGLSSDVILSVYCDSKGKVWCGTGWGGVNRFYNNKFEVIDNSDGLASNTVFSIQEDHEQQLWFGTSEGVSRYNPESGTIVNYGPKDGLGGKHIYHIFRDHKDRLWFSVLGGHLSRYENGKFTTFDSTKGLNEKFITCISEDKDGNLWFGAYGSGIYRYDGNTFTNYSTKDGLSSDFPYSIASDNANNLWIGTSRGVDQFVSATEIFKQHRKKEGFMGIEPNPNALYKDHHGDIWIGTIMGVAKFDLSKKLQNDQEALLHFSSLTLNYQNDSLPEDHALSYRQNNITFHFLGVSLSNPDHVNYSYLLEGFDSDWSPVTQHAFATYSNLPPGNYTFKVRATNNDGKWTEKPTTLTFSIIPPFWKTWWFYLLSAIFIVVVLFYGDRFRTKRLMEAKKQLEIKVVERTQELADKNDELAHKNREILDSIHYAKRIQGAILPTEKELKTHLPHSFVFYQPKDIVSGDFYWMAMVEEKILFAAADCTGHGVPGAFMSIIGFNGLNKIVKEEQITQPAEILNRLSAIVEDTLQYSDEFEINDGLDIAICALDSKKLKLEYAGAFNPLYMVRNGQLAETKADRKPVGRSIVMDPKKKFSNHEINIQKNDTFYIFSDGYADQFGGPNGRKFRYKQFKELLVTANKSPMEKQKDIIDTAIRNWQGEIEQIDDMVIMGVKII
jgi:ligand-binding sensor domain-containing protein/serine phosphatase RsbU (regulator of sigma subunit)